MMGVYEDLEESGIQVRMKKRRLCENQNEDRLSDLPDCVILHILSLLNTEHAVRTCVLSTKWKHLWKRIPTLILHSSRFTTVKKFASFVSNILTLRDTSTALHALDLVRRSIEPQLLKKILNYVYSHNTHLRELGILVSGDSSRILNCVSSCQALTSLKLSLYSRGSNNTETLFPKSLNLPLLTTLDLTNFAFDGGESGCADPFLAFTKLNSLVICSCKVKDASILRISSETLVNLAIDSPLEKVSLFVQHNLPDVAIVELSTPNLCTFKFTTRGRVQKICESGFSSVKQVNIYSQDFSASVEHALVLRSWLQNFANVESLTVTSTVLQILSLLPDLLEVKLPSLCYLKSLEVKLVPLLYGLLFLKLEDAMIKKAAAKSRKEVAKLRKEFKAGLKPPAIPDGIVDFLRQNSPSAEVKITTEYSWSHFNIKQIEESIKGVKIIKYPSRLAASASNASPASAIAAPPNLHLYGTEKVEESIKGVKIIKYHSKFAGPAFSFASPASAAESACALATAPPSALPASAAESACALAAAPPSALPASVTESACALAAAPSSASATSPNLHPCRAKQMVTNIDNSDSTLWPDSVTKAFIKIMVDEVTKGNMSNGMFHTRTWTSMTTLLNSITNCSYKMEQLKEKMHSLRAMFHEFYSLLQNTEFKWNVETNTVIASDNDWQNYLKTHDRASQFLNKGCDHYKLLEMIFNKNNEAEVLHASTQDRPNADKENEFDNQNFNTGSANDNSYNDIEEVECIKCRGKQRSQVQEHTSRKESASNQKENALACGKNVEITSSHVTIDCSLTKCVVALEEIKDISDETFGKTLEKFKDPDWREMFMAMSNDRKRGWLFRL
ncbi:uncharacterized protein LOC131602780 isoform X2 [Vicia villosa]|uniref:uncharacterized protein LOC131602780 isoform X2 n=1 Tax=Vicia villosa TaxID=3911 RepID=UPI00273AA83B|nr:uncharacterized protein LOC131602780 isoform X2 [Vicia villosa]